MILAGLIMVGHALLLDDGQEVLAGELREQFHPELLAVLDDLVRIPAFIAPDDRAALLRDRVFEVALDLQLARLRREIGLRVVAELPQLPLDVLGFPLLLAEGEFVGVELLLVAAADPTTGHPREQGVVLALGVVLLLGGNA